MTEDLLMLSSYKYRSGFMLHIPRLKMTLESYFLVPLIFLSQLVFHSADQESDRGPCPPFRCGDLGEVGFPFSNTTNPECGLCVMNCAGPEPQVQFHEQGKWYRVVDMRYWHMKMEIHDQDDVQSHLESDLRKNVSPFLNINVTRTPPLVKCKHGPPPVFPPGFFFYISISCKGYDLYLFDDDEDRSVPESPPSRCSFVPRPPRSVQSHELCMATENPAAWDGYFFTIHWKVWSNCTKCHDKGGRCLNKPDRTLKCGNLKKGGTVTRKIGISIGVGAAGSIILLCIVFIIYKHHKSNKSSDSSALISGDLSLEPYLEHGSIYLQTQIFTYEELEEATNHFDINRKLGDGGFGTVYHGKLRDGRVVAVKRLFEHNYKRVEQFRNEILILSELRHPNLVPLYGCTNRYSRHLLLVYEYIPNGTVADHLHGSRANDGLLTWPIRLSIAIESANALAYLHASTIIHRDVKTNNILLDNSFHVKVADFGLSRLFPMNVTHISTAPQGTPGYVDPEYHQCYQLTDKSDVYSLGVVLIELISSKPAVDIGRHRHEINLASMALNKIHNQALHELVDPYLGFDTDYGTRNTIILVAELAFRCLQQQKEMRPCMAEVLQILQGIESDEYRKNNIDELDIPADEQPLKNSHPLSPNSVTDKWVSKSVTPNTSGSDPL